MLVKYKQYACSYGAIIVFENGYVEFIPNNEDGTDLDLDFDDTEVCELLGEDVKDFSESLDMGEFLDNLGKEK